MLKDSFVLVTHGFHEEESLNDKHLVSEMFLYRRYVNVKDISDVWEFTCAEQTQKIKGCIGQFFHGVSPYRVVFEYPCVVILKGNQYYLVHPSHVTKLIDEK